MASACIKRVLVIGAKDQTDSYKLMKIGDIIVTYSSNIIVEAAYWGKLSISLSRNMRYTDCKSVITIKKFNEIPKILSIKNFKPKSKENCFPLAYYLQMYGKSYKFYKPINHFDGKILGINFEWKPKFLIIIEKIFPIFKKYLKKILIILYILYHMKIVMFHYIRNSNKKFKFFKHYEKKFFEID